MRYLAVILLLGCLAITLTEAQPKRNKSCRAVFTDQTRRQLGTMTQCVKKLGYKTGKEKSEKQACVMKCVLTEMKLLNEEGEVNLDTFNDYLNQEWPEHLHDRANATFSSCLDAGIEYDPSDEYCKGYEPLMKCLTRNMPNLCKGAR